MIVMSVTPLIKLYPFDGLVQDCSNSSALAMEILQSCTKLSSWIMLTCVCCDCRHCYSTGTKYASTVQKMSSSSCPMLMWPNTSPSTTSCKNSGAWDPFWKKKKKNWLNLFEKWWPFQVKFFLMPWQVRCHGEPTNLTGVIQYCAQPKNDE